MIYEFEGYQIKPHKQWPASLIVVTAGRGGKIPDILSGLFTSVGTAKQAITVYLESKANAKTNSESRTQVPL